MLTIFQIVPRIVQLNPQSLQTTTVTIIPQTPNKRISVPLQEGCGRVLRPRLDGMKQAKVPIYVKVVRNTSCGWYLLAGKGGLLAVKFIDDHECVDGIEKPIPVGIEVRWGFRINSRDEIA